MTEAPWVARNKAVPEVLPMAQKLMILSEEMDAITAPEWDTPSTKEEVRRHMLRLDTLRQEINDLWEQVVR